LIKESKKTPVEVDKLKAIFFDNNKNYLEDVYVLNHKKYKVFYFEENEEILGYISTYYKKDFIKNKRQNKKLLCLLFLFHTKFQFIFSAINLNCLTAWNLWTQK